MAEAYSFLFPFLGRLPSYVMVSAFLEEGRVSDVDVADRDYPDGECDAHKG